MALGYKANIKNRMGFRRGQLLVVLYRIKSSEMKGKLHVYSVLLS
jgi:hypothetical protein